MQRSEYKAVLLRAMQEASDTKQKADLMTELTVALSAMIAASCLHYRGNEGDLLDGIAATCRDIRSATTNAYVSVQIRMREAARGQNS